MGTTWCRFGVGDSVGMAIRLEERYKSVRAPHKFKGAVSGCVRECAEAQNKEYAFPIDIMSLLSDQLLVSVLLRQRKGLISLLAATEAQNRVIQNFLSKMFLQRWSCLLLIGI